MFRGILKFLVSCIRHCPEDMPSAVNGKGIPKHLFRPLARSLGMVSVCVPFVTESIFQFFVA